MGSDVIECRKLSIEKKQSGTEDYLDDSVITSKVKAVILHKPDLSTVEINFEKFKVWIRLSGFVKYRADISKAVAVAWDVDDVNMVKNDMRHKETRKPS